MFCPSKVTQHAAAAISRLAEVYPSPDLWLTSTDIARARRLRKPALGKVLSVLTRAQIVTGSPGPGGGYRLARHPGDITLWDVVQLFERSSSMCPYGPHWCGHHEPCPLHDSLTAMQTSMEALLKSITFAPFTRREAPQSSAAGTTPVPGRGRGPRRSA